MHPGRECPALAAHHPMPSISSLSCIFGNFDILRRFVAGKFATSSWSQLFNSSVHQTTFVSFLAAFRTSRAGSAMLAELLGNAQHIAAHASPVAASAATAAANQDRGPEDAAKLAHAAMVRIRSCMQSIQFTDLRLGCTLDSLTGSLGAPVLHARPPCVRFFDVLDHAALSVALVIVPPGSCIPLHDHPGMHVFSKVLAGQLDAEMFDVDYSLPPFAVPLGLTVGVGKSRTITLRTGDLCELTPVVGNIHGLTCTGHETAVVLDVMLPPYPSNGACHYFAATDSSAQLSVIDEALAWAMCEDPAEGRRVSARNIIV